MKSSKSRQININYIVLGIVFAIAFVSVFTYIPIYLNTVEQKNQELQQDIDLQSMLLKQIFKPVVNANTEYRKNLNTQIALQEIQSLWLKLNAEQPNQTFFLIHKDPTTEKLELKMSSEKTTSLQEVAKHIKPTMYMALGGHHGIQTITDITDKTIITAYAPVIPNEWGVIIEYKEKTISPSFIDILSYTLFSALLVTLVGWLVLRVTIRRLNNRVTTSEKRYEQLLNNSPDWIWEIDNIGNINYSSKQVYSILGYKPEELLSKPFISLFDHHDSKNLQLNWQQKMMLSEPFSDLEIGLLSKSKKHVHMLVSGQPILNKEHKTLGFRGIAKDISTIKQRD
ncbi:MAG: PAS domain S-box protein, partial [Thiomicrorhabdus sp.]|nr:PAS domain S-box protein [Thiomicrorhabdus sp.]